MYSRLSAGVSQSSVLSPLLFSISGTGTDFLILIFHVYLDDLQNVLTVENIAVVNTKVNLMEHLQTKTNTKVGTKALVTTKTELSQRIFFILMNSSVVLMIVSWISMTHCILKRMTINKTSNIINSILKKFNFKSVKMPRLMPSHNVLFVSFCYYRYMSNSMIIIYIITWAQWVDWVHGICASAIDVTGPSGIVLRLTQNCFIAKIMIWYCDICNKFQYEHEWTIGVCIIYAFL